MNKNLLFDLALIILLSKILGAVSRKFKYPPVIGMLLLGILLGPTVFHLIESGEVIQWIARIGVIFLLFEAGLGTDLKRIKEDSRQALLPAFGGIIIPFTLGFLLEMLFDQNLQRGLIMGVIFTATSVSVSVMTLIDLKKIRGLEGRCIVNAAIIDDIIGILLLTLIFGMTIKSETGSTDLLLSLGKIILFFSLTIIAGIYLIKPLFMNLRKLMLENDFLALAIAFAFLYSFFAELNGLAAITGAYFIGLFLGQTEYKERIQVGISSLGKTFFVDIFFVSIGLEFNLLKIDVRPLFLIGFVVLAVMGKLFGSGLGARLTNFDMIRSFRIGAGMIPRGEVALIVANMAFEKGLVSSDILSATILMVVISAFITPFLLKYGFTKLQKKSF